MDVIVAVERFFAKYYIVGKRFHRPDGLTFGMLGNKKSHQSGTQCFHIPVKVVKTYHAPARGRMLLQERRQQMYPRVEHHHQLAVLGKLLQRSLYQFRMRRVDEEILYPASREILHYIVAESFPAVHRRVRLTGLVPYDAHNCYQLDILGPQPLGQQCRAEIAALVHRHSEIRKIVAVLKL